MTTKTTKKAPARKATKGAKASVRKPVPAKPKAKTGGNGEAKKLSAIDAAAKVLAESRTAMNAKELIEALSTQGLWTSPGGKTPHATLYAAIAREIASKGKDTRFVKAERGKFAAKA